MTPYASRFDAACTEQRVLPPQAGVAGHLCSKPCRRRQGVVSEQRTLRAWVWCRHLSSEPQAGVSS
eukprot:scaffold19055_cov48-Phaeocystis_antarctica.AAC.4